MAKTKELLKVLDIQNKSDQEEKLAEMLCASGYGGEFFKDKNVYAEYVSVYSDGIEPHYKLHLPMEIIAFRLRDEIKDSGFYYEAIELVYKHRVNGDCVPSRSSFMVHEVKPIDIIIAALIAKEQEKE